MKKFIRLFSLLSLALIFTAATAKAQSEYTGEVEFPFAFSVGDREYTAGRYGVMVNRTSGGTATIIFKDLRNDRLQIVLARRTGDSPAADMSVVFEKAGENRVLDRIITPYGGFAVNRTSNEVRVAVLDLKHLYKPAVVNVNDLF